MVGLSETELLKSQYRSALVSGRTERANAKEVELKELTLQSHGSLYVFANGCRSFAALRDPATFASASYLAVLTGREGLAAGMLRHTRRPIPTSLTQLPDHRHVKRATSLFKHILGYMGDKQYQQPETLATEVLGAGVEVAELRREIFCQLMKQLSGNPDPASERKGWLLLMLCLCSFPPGSSLEYHIQVFIRDHPAHNTAGGDEEQMLLQRKQSLIDQCHKIAFQKPANAAPPPVSRLIGLAQAMGFPRGTTPQY